MLLGSVKPNPESVGGDNGSIFHGRKQLDEHWITPDKCSDERQIAFGFDKC